MLCILIRYVVSPGPGELARYVVEVYTGSYDGYRFQPPIATSDRVFYVAVPR